MGEGVVRDAAGERVPTADVSSPAGITPVELREKEGLALINGTDGMLGQLGWPSPTCATCSPSPTSPPP